MPNPKLVVELLNVLVKARPQRGYTTREAPNAVQVLDALAEVLRILARSTEDNHPRNKAYEYAATVLEQQTKRARATGWGSSKLEASPPPDFFAPIAPTLPAARAAAPPYPLKKGPSR